MVPCDSSSQLNSHVSWVSILVPNFNQVPEQHWHKWNSNTKPFIPHCNAAKNVTHSKSTFHLKAKTLQHQYVTSGRFRFSNGQTVWLWMDTSPLLWYQRNRGQTRQAPQRVQHKSFCWWPERRRPAKEGPLPGLRHSHLSLFLPDCIVNRGLKGGRQKRCLVQAVLSSMEVCSEWVLLLFLLFLWERVVEALGGGSMTDGLWVTTAFVDGGVPEWRTCCLFPCMAPKSWGWGWDGHKAGYRGIWLRICEGATTQWISLYVHWGAVIYEHINW